MIYLDNNATTAIDPDVLDAMRQTWEIGPLNPSSQHAAGRRARALVQDATAEIGRLLGTDVLRTGGSRLLLTSGGTEANNWVIESMVDAECPRWISTIEHPSILAAAQRHAARGYPVHWIPVDNRGIVLVDRLAEMLVEALGEPGDDPPATAALPVASGRRPPRGLVSVMAANNETGALQPIGAIAELCRRWRVAFHTDATQWIGKLPFDFDALGISAATLTAHKFHGPAGIGGLVLAPNVDIHPLFIGGDQQLGLRGGTESVPLVVGMQRALAMATRNMNDAIVWVSGLRDLFERQLQHALPGSRVHAADTPRLPGTTSIAFPGVDRQTLLIRLDISGVACSTGSACTSGSSQPSHVLRAMGVSPSDTESTLRFGVSRFSTTEEVLAAAERIISCVHKLRSR